jgi:hypothetical protein
MALGTVFGQSAITLAFASAQHETTAAGCREIVSVSGAQEFITADGVTHKTPGTGTVTAVEVDMYQDLASTALWRYLRETASTTGTLTIGGTANLTESSSNPEHVYSVTGWVRPQLSFKAGSIETVTATFYVSGNPTVDVT